MLQHWHPATTLYWHPATTLAPCCYTVLAPCCYTGTLLLRCTGTLLLHWHPATTLAPCCYTGTLLYNRANQVAVKLIVDTLPALAYLQLQANRISGTIPDISTMTSLIKL